MTSWTFCVGGHECVSEYSQMLGIEANSLLKLKTLISFWIVAKMCVCRSWNQLQLSGHPTSRLKDGVKVSTSACCGGWSQSLNIRKMTHYYYWRSIKRKKRLTWIEWSCSRCSPFSFPSPLSKISVKAQMTTIDLFTSWFILSIYHCAIFWETML